MRLSREDFEEWLDNPVTVKVFAILSKGAEEAKAAWIAKAWHKGDLSPETLAAHKERAAALEQLVTMDYDDYLGWAKEAGEDTSAWNK